LTKQTRTNLAAVDNLVAAVKADAVVVDAAVAGEVDYAAPKI